MLLKKLLFYTFTTTAVLKSDKNSWLVLKQMKLSLSFNTNSTVYCIMYSKNNRGLVIHILSQ
jgi:hypothetical protein